MTPQEALELKHGDRLRVINDGFCASDPKVNMEVFFIRMSPNYPAMVEIKWDRTIGNDHPMDGGWLCSRFEKVEGIEIQIVKDPGEIVDCTHLFPQEPKTFGPFKDFQTARPYLNMMEYPVWVSAEFAIGFGGKGYCNNKEEAIKLAEGGFNITIKR